MLKRLISKNRSYRRFFEEQRISSEQLKEWINLARLAASGRNAQSLKYIIVRSEAAKEKVFQNLVWAGYLKDWSGPKKGERPAAYIIMLNDESIGKNYFCDDGIAVQNLLLGAVESGYGGCIVRAFKDKEIRDVLNLDDEFKIIQVVALGKPKEQVVLEEIKDGDFKYWRDENGIHHVPKRNLNEIIMEEI